MTLAPRSRYSVARAVLAAVMVGAVGCGAPLGPPQQAPPALRDLTELLPPDLDVAIDVDVTELRARLSNAQLARAFEVFQDYPERARALLQLVLSRSTRALAGFRPTMRLSAVDGVLVAQGDFRDVYPARFGFALEHDIGATWRSYRAVHVTQRYEPARVYASGDDVLVFVSSAELDSVSLLIEATPTERSSAPASELAERVLPAVAAEGSAVFGWRAFRSPAALHAVPLARCWLQARTLRGSLRLQGSTARLELTATYGSSASAAENVAQVATCSARDAAALDLSFEPVARPRVEARRLHVSYTLRLPESALREK